MIKKWYIEKVKKPAAATFDEWSDWTSATKNKHPILYFMFDTLPVFVSVKRRRFKDFFYHLRQKYCLGYHWLRIDVKRFKYPYNKEKISKYSWIESEDQLALFSFQILVNFVEKEIGYEDFKEQAYSDDDGQRSIYYKKLLELYHWFIDDYCDSSYSEKLRKELKEKFSDHKILEKRDIFSKPNTPREREYELARSEMISKITSHDEELERQMTENLMKLAKLRGVMWS